MTLNNINVVEETVALKDEIQSKASGSDNRNIYDDGRSQKLSADEIQELKSDLNKASEIVETLITNSNTFHNKTEYSQEKYLKKKEKKYFEYIQILRPNLRHIAEIMYKLEPTKIQGIRMDTLSQIITMSNVSNEGNHLLYDSGSNGLLAAALLSAIGQEGSGKLIHMHPGNMSQKQALLAMNFDTEQLNKCISVNVYSALRQVYQGCDVNTGAASSNGESENPLKRKASDNVSPDNAKVSKLDNADSKGNNSEDTKDSAPKKPKWHFDNIAAAEVLEKKVDSLVIACKEDPENIFLELFTFVKPGRPFVVYYNVVEPLQNLYTTLKCHSNVAALKITCNWMRNYQILPERTHPEVMMNNSSGFLLTGYILK
ncbi:tRNA (adenine(58)-N(1))-methyltransferase non-catalytic subunit TRM6 [Aricia agestis]|uniref:tRNA (adenine(58)-N(1))-methyltransferase non-catalytic subunit TRM6 n=1 Tax=Aricia agestis TaxID=91739 RepID=UPI001C205739|nr:tRNA (adenine(58)-N(1))-methyltransferase non-catalytic subunit TRM6 [Aricia agestis]